MSPPPAKEADPTAASPAAKSFAERLRARREAAERAGEAAGDDLGGGLHLRPAGYEKPETLPAPTNKPEPKAPTSRLIPPPAPEKVAEQENPEPKPEPRAPEPAAAAGTSEPEATKAPPPPPPPPETKRDFEEAPFKTADTTSENRPRFAPRDDRVFSSFDNPPGAPARDQGPALPAGQDTDFQQSGSGGWFAPRNDTTAPSPSYDNYRRSEASNDYARSGAAGPSYAGNYNRDDELYDDIWYDDDQGDSYRGGHAQALNSVDDDEQFEPERRRPELSRPTANDYADTYYDEYDDEYEYVDEEPRSRGPLLLFAGLAGVGVIAAGLIYFYLQNQPTTGPNAKIPEVPAPSKPPKTAAPKQEAPPAAQQTKLFYDRIVGETTVPGTRLQPREEQPLDPGNSAEPQPLQPLTPDQLDSGDLPVPLPPPLPGTSGSLQPGTNDSGATTQVAAPANSTSVAQVSQTEPVTPTGWTSPLPRTDDDPALPDTGVPQLQPVVNLTETLSLTNSLLPRPRAKPLAVIRAARAAADKKKTRVASVSPITAAPTEPLSIIPLPGSQPRRPTQPAPLPAVELPPAQQQPATQAPPSRVPRVGLRDDELGLTSSQQFAARLPAAPTTPAAQPQPATPSVPSVAYVVQLASYKDQTSALAGFQELRARHPSLLNRFQPLISKKAVGNFGTFYRLQVGPMASSQAGNQICASLLAAGEKDCLVRRR